MDFIALLTELKDRELEARVWELWLVEYPQMTEDNFTSYAEMLATAKQREVHPEDGTETHGLFVDQMFL